jgi:hypothetical protein
MEPILHVMSKNGIFLFRFNNGEFGSKWCGIWNRNKKYFDYFAFRIGDQFLSESNFKEFSFYNSQFSTMIFETSKGKVTEEIACYDDCVLVSVTPSYSTNISAEIGVNIREKDENYLEGKKYGLTEIKNGIKIDFEGTSAFIYFLKGDFKLQEYYGVHSPGAYALEKGLTHYLDTGEMQNKYIPGYTFAKLDTNETYDLVLSSKELDFDTLYKLIKNKIKYAENYGEIIKTESRKFEVDQVDKELIMDSIDSIYSYTNFNKKEIYAGFPYFNEFWLRDALLILPSFLSMGNFSFVRDILVKLANEIKEGGLPSILGGSSYPKDVLGLFIIDVYEYYKYTGDESVVELLKEKKDNIMQILNKWFDDGFIHDNGRETWMDSIDREYSIEIQAIWIKALSRLYDLYQDVNANQMTERLSKSLDSMFKEGYFKDQRDVNINSANQIFALYFGILDEEKAIATIKNVENNMLSEQGVLSVSKNDGTFDFNSYQRGAVWPMLTQLFSAAAYFNGRTALGKKILSILKQNDNIQCSSRINEIIQPDGIPKGCPSQAWSLCLLPFIIERYILGIEPDVPNNKIKVMKRNGITGKKTLNINDYIIEISIADGKVKSNCNCVEMSDSFILEF